jgi:pyrimidine-nucleoside phosphorylase
MIPAVVISKKRDRHPLSTEEIEFMISGYARGEIPDYQMAAFAMAIFIQGMDRREIADLTEAMIRSGDTLRRVSDRPRVDKHSTGGLGDKTSLILAPLLACCDLDVPMISGRGLGITGGTLDKLEAIPGFRCDLTESESEAQLKEIQCFITGATDRLVPADKKLYALRDVTGTVPSIALITASIMSKKIAETLDALVLDVKCGSGAFLATDDLACALARSLIEVGRRAGVVTTALITDMDQPLGAMVGNACEVDEAMEVLRDGGPSDVRELTIELCARVLLTTGKASDLVEARQLLKGHLASGAAMERWERMVSMQGGILRRPVRSVAPMHGVHRRQASSPRSMGNGSVKPSSSWGEGVRWLVRRSIPRSVCGWSGALEMPCRRVIAWSKSFAIKACVWSKPCIWLGKRSVSKRGRPARRSCGAITPRSLGRERPMDYIERKLSFVPRCRVLHDQDFTDVADRKAGWDRLFGRARHQRGHLLDAAEGGDSVLLHGPFGAAG